MSGDVAEATKAKVVIGGMLHKVYAALGHEFLSANNFVSSNGVESQLNGFQPMGTNTLSISGKVSIELLVKLVILTKPGDSIPSMAPASTTPSWDLGTPMDFDFNSSQLQPLGSMIDMPNDFDWVRSPFIFLYATCFNLCSANGLRTPSTNTSFPTLKQTHHNSGPIALKISTSATSW